MVDCQIHTAGVDVSAILDVFGNIPRERFVPKNMQKIAYIDEDLSIGGGRFLLAPALHALMIQAVDPRPEDVVLDVGGATGYSAAILSFMTTTVVALEGNEKYLDFAMKLWDELGVCNVAGFCADMAAGNSDNAPFDIIFINGAVADIPDGFVKQLRVGGRLVAVLRPSLNAPGCVTIVQSLGKNRFSSYIVTEAGCSYLPGFEPQSAFVF